MCIICHIGSDIQLHRVCLVAAPTCHPSPPQAGMLCAKSKIRSSNQPDCVPSLLGLPSRGSTRVLHCIVACTNENCLQLGCASHLARQSSTLRASSAPSSLRLSQSVLLPAIIWGVTYSLNTSPCLKVSEVYRPHRQSRVPRCCINPSTRLTFACAIIHRCSNSHKLSIISDDI